MRTTERLNDFFVLIRIILIVSISILLLILDQALAVTVPERSVDISVQERHTISGTVVDAQETTQPLVGATVYIPSLERGTTTDLDGRFEIRNLPEGELDIRFSYIGYRSRTFTVTIPAGEELQLELVPDLFETEAVIVTATPTRSAVNYQSARSYSERELERRAAVSLGEMLDGEPGLSSRSFGGGPARPVIRGFDGERLVVLENGERMGDIQSTAPDHAITLDPFGMSRVEVVRGPASLLYGSSALGGVINLFTEDYAREWDQGWSGGISSHGATNNALLSGGGGLIYGAEDYSVTGRLIYRNSGDNHTPVGPLPNTRINSYTASAGVGFNRDRLQGGVSARYYENNYGIPEFSAETDPDNPDRFVEVQPDMEIRINRWNLQAAATVDMDGFFDEFDFRASGSYSIQEEGEPNPLPEELELEIRTATLSSTAMLLHRPVGIFDQGVIGANLHIRYQEVDGIEAYHPGEDIANLALFSFQEIPLFHNLRLQAGARLEHEWVGTVPNRFFGVAEQVSDRMFNLAGSVGLNYRPVNGLEFGTQIARAHRNPTILERYADGWHAGATRIELGDPSLESEIGYGIDLFARWTGNRAQLEVSGFYNRVDNYIALRTLAANCGEITYRVEPDREFAQCVQFFAADAHLRGFEMTGAAYLLEHLRLNLGIDFVQGDRRDVTGEPLPLIPPFRTTMGLMFDNNRFHAGGDLRLVSAQSRVPENELPTDGYAILRLQTGFRFEAGGVHSLNLRLDNALNATYMDHMSVVRRYPDPVLGPDAPRRYYMPGRNLNLVYRFTF